MVEWCYLCKKSGESIDHLMLHCDVARELWSYLLTLFGVEQVMPRRVLLYSWGGWVGCGTVKEIWRLALLCLMWCLWRERNVQHFEDVETSIIDLRKLMLNMLHLWIVEHLSLIVSTFADFFEFMFLSFFPIRSSFLYFLYTRVAPLCTLLMIWNYI
jgi:hypothetical protein